MYPNLRHLFCPHTELFGGAGLKKLIRIPIWGIEIPFLWILAQKNFTCIPVWDIEILFWVTGPKMCTYIPV